MKADGRKKRRGMIRREPGRPESITEKGSYRKEGREYSYGRQYKKGFNRIINETAAYQTIRQDHHQRDHQRMRHEPHEKDSKDWKSAFTAMLHKIESYRAEAINFYNGVPRDKAESLMNYIFYAVFNDIVTTMILDLGIEEKDYDFMLKFICYGFVGTVLEWISNGLPEDEIDEIVRRTALIVEGTGWKRLKESV